MPYQPGANEVYVSRTLANVAVASAQDLEKNFVATKVFPRIPVQQQDGKYFTFASGNWNRRFAKVRGPNSEVNTSGFPISTDTYSCKLYGVGSDIDQNTLANQDPAVQIKRRKTRWCTQQMYLEMEADWAAKYFATSIWTNGRTGHASTDDATNFIYWDSASGTPLKNVLNAKSVVIKASGGFEPNCMVVGADVYFALKTQAEILDRIKFTSDEVINQALMARYFEVDDLWVCKGVVNSAEEGQSDSQDYIQGRHAMLCYCNKNPSIDDTSISAGYQFSWEGMEGQIQGMQIADIPIPLRRSERIELQAAWDFKVVSAACGYFFNTAVNAAV